MQFTLLVGIVASCLALSVAAAPIENLNALRSRITLPPLIGSSSSHFPSRCPTILRAHLSRNQVVRCTLAFENNTHQTRYKTFLKHPHSFFRARLDIPAASTL
ncbi:hypothetical protein R3P38DRAFT_2848937 [Favolaschia claudopus]|uniref:Uncharacterized protein n=1 Tax=Favolaschia claudopus TaxID=2862362 RepID=A0AAW0DWB8_9AGAR